MNEYNDSDQEPHKPTEQIHGGHFALIALCALVLIFITFMKNGFHLPANAANFTAANQGMTYEQAKAEVVAQDGQAPATNDGQLQDQLAQVDPNLTAGDVLGTSTLENAFPPADEMVTPAMLDKIKIIDANETGADAIKKYSDLVSYVEANNNTLGILNGLNSDDTATLQKTSDSAKKMVAELARVPVPKELITYHKVKMMYYTTISYIALAMNGDKTMDMSSLSQILFSLSEKIGSVQDEFMAKYQVQI